MKETAVIKEKDLHNIIEQTEKASSSDKDKIINKALKLKGLSCYEAAVLLNIKNRGELQRLFDAASRIKNLIYGRRLVLFAPLYISNYCSNSCLYCGYRKENTGIKRKCLSNDQIKDEVRALLRQGHKRILMLMGENPQKCSFDYFLNSIKTAYEVAGEDGSYVRRINVEVPPLEPGELRKLADSRIGTYTVFQETYHRPTYEKMHPGGRKSDYFFRLSTMDRALENGLNDVGIGALFGLYDYRFEVLSLLEHSSHLDKKFGVGPHTISVPRVEPAAGAPLSHNTPHPVSDMDFKKIVAVLRCAVPYTGIILSTRESPLLREELFNLGVSQISAGSRTSPGGYEGEESCYESGQFSLNDNRPAGDVIKSVIKLGYIPSFCTGCYRLGRVGTDFMELAKPGLIKLHCLPNALTTLKEYLVDYADEETRRAGEKLIDEKLGDIPDCSRRRRTEDFLGRIEKGERDLYF